MSDEKVPLKLTSGRKITLPKEVCNELNIEVGDHIVLEIKGDKAEIRTFGDYEVKE